jgi:hypothetical protein
MTRDKMMELLAIMNSASAKAISLAGATDEQLEFALFHEAMHLSRNSFSENCDVVIEALTNN